MRLHHSLNRLRRCRSLRVLVGCYLSLSAIFSLAFIFGIRLNATASLPLGLYIKTGLPTQYVSFCLEGDLGRLALQRSYVAHGNCPTGGYPLLKTIVGLPGDMVTYDARGISINGKLLPKTDPRIHDDWGHVVSHYPFGVYRVQPNTYWVASSYDNRSFDSRYYGPIRAADIRAHLHPLWIAR